MTSRLVHRPARVVRWPAAQPPRPLEAPPTLPEARVGSSAQALLPVAGVGSSLTMMLLFRGSAFAGLGALVLLVAVGGGLAMLLGQRGRARRTRRQQRERYLDYLEEVRERLAAEEKATRAKAVLLDPPPAALWDLARDPARRWERRRADPDFLALRVGTGELPAAPIELHDQGSALTPTDPFMLAEAKAIVRRFGTTAAMPLLVPLDRVGNVSLVGPREEVLALARALLTRLAVTHAPDDVALAIAHPPGLGRDWAWAGWLPHLLDPDRPLAHVAGVVAGRRTAPDPASLARLLAPELAERSATAAEARRSLGARNPTALAARLVVVHDSWGQVASDLPLPDSTVSAAELGLSVLHLVADRLQEPAEVALRLTVTDGRVLVEDLRERKAPARPLAGLLDQVPAATAGGLARLLAPLRLSPDSVDDGPQAGPVDAAGLLGLREPARLDPVLRWAATAPGPDGGPARDLLRVPIGIDDDGVPVLLDLKEPAQLGMGPHGLCVGATGSGKSELLRMLVLALLVSHPPERLAMVLVDYKGGASFAPFAAAPHVAGVITNLAGDAGLIERAHASLAGEVKRRQQVLADAGNLANLADYELERARRPELAALPHLLVVIDEFAELLAAQPDFIELLLTIGRIGRSIGVHLLLASQSIEGSRLRGLESYLSYRLGLRTFSEAESRTVLDTPDAFHLPPLPGFGYLKVDTTVYRRFKAGYVSGPERAGPAPAAAEDEPARPLALGPYDPAPAAEADGAALPERQAGPTLLDAVVARLTGAARPVPRVWLPPLPAAVTLDQVAGRPTVSANGEGRGLSLARRPGPMRVPLGLLDDPAGQRQGPWTLDLRLAGGHVAIVGGPQSGKTTLLRSLVAGLALTHTPAQVSVYGLDLAGGGLGQLAELPHVGGIAGRLDRERLRRTCEELLAMLEHRERLFRERGIDAMDALRRRHQAGELPELPMADVVLVVDGFGAVRGDFEELEPLLTELLQRGGGYGLHVVAAMLRWNDVRIALQATFGTRLELRLGDPADSTIDRRLAATLRPDQPGRVLTEARLLAQAALPRIDGLAEPAGLGPAIDAMARASAAAWSGARAPRVRVLPARLAADALPDQAGEPRLVPVALDERALAPVLLDLFERDQHLLVFGDGQCGKTNLLRLIATGLAARYSPEEVVIGVFDPRRGLAGVVDEAWLGGYASNTKVCGGLAAGIAKELAARMPDETTEQAKLIEGSWFDGPRVVLLVDDYDVLTTAGQQPLAPFVPYLPSARDIGLHVVLARRVAGAARAAFEPFLQTVIESGTSALVMAGERTEGQLFPGVWAGPQPPGRGLWVRRGERPRLVQTAVADQAPAERAGGRGEAAHGRPPEAASTPAAP